MHALNSARLPALLAPVLGAVVLIATAALHFRPAANGPTGDSAGSRALSAPVAEVRPPPNLSEIAGWPLFGTPRAEDLDSAAAKAEDQAEAEAPSLENLPPATLPLQLKGIAFSADGSRAYAIIGAADGTQREYQAGDELQPGVTLHSLKLREVVISNAGKLESLALPVPDGAGGPGGRALPSIRPQLPRIQGRLPVPPPPPPISVDAPPAEPAGP